MRDILKMDSTFQSKMGLLNNCSLSELKKVRDELNAPIEDDSPKKLTLVRYGLNPDYCERCRGFFDADIIEDEEEISGILWFGDIRRDLDISVKRAIKALLQTGVTSDKRVSDAVNLLFMGVAREILDSKYFTAKDFAKALKPKDDPIAKNLAKTLKELVKEE